MKKAIIGYGGHAREVAAQLNEDVSFFVDDEYANDIALPLSKFDPAAYQILIGIGDCKVREDIVSRLPKNVKFFTFVHPTALIMDSSITLQEGCFIGAYSILTTNIKLGKHCILNRGCQIGHDTEIGDYLSMMPNSILSGNCKIGDRVYIGTNSTTREKINIGNDIIIGLNSGIICDITEPGIYGGVPSRKLK
jgi:sugar O-acyltransferase (sialic acid O-acetyltransferase NeuD family)